MSVNLDAKIQYNYDLDYIEHFDGIDYERLDMIKYIQHVYNQQPECSSDFPVTNASRRAIEVGFLTVFTRMAHKLMGRCLFKKFIEEVNKAAELWESQQVQRS
jgi:hypothetical protein